jgi:AraC-like DNA-binding protein
LAQRQLELPGASISRVSALIGYGSEAAFNRAFKKLMGVPPGQWRKRHAGQFMAATMN